MATAKELPSHLGDVQRRLRRGYTIERTGGGHFRVLDPEGRLVQYQGKNLTLTGTGRSDAVVRMETALQASGVLREKGQRKSKPSPSSQRGIVAMREALRVATNERRRKALELKAAMEPWWKKIGADTPGVVWDLARYLHASSNGVFPTPESAVHTIRNVMDGNGVKDASREALWQLSNEFAAEDDPLGLYVDLARKARGIETSGALGEIVLPAGKEWPFVVELIALEACFADDRYQRPPGDRFIRDIVLNFDERLVGTIEVSVREGGRYAILDGQTRWRACQLVGKKRLYAAIYEGMDLAAEARFFYRVNKHRKGVHPFYGFRARVLSGEEKAVEIDRLVEAHGLRIRAATASERGEVGAVAALEWAYDLPSPHREDTLSPALRVIGSTWAGLKKSVDAELIRGLARFYAVFGDEEIVDSERDPRFQDLLQATGPLLILARARDIAGAFGSSRAATGLALAKALVGVHNTGLGRAERLDVNRLDRSR